MHHQISQIIDQIERVIVGKREILIQVMIGLLSEGHILIEDVPGVGKTQLVATLAKVLDGDFKRIQFTPEVTPSDITGFAMFNQKTMEFEYRAGVSMCNFLLADEINRASSRTQSSLLEIMEEGRVTVDGITYTLPKPFTVLATQNPIENYGTYHLPEAQMDRFFIKLSIGYPNKSSELQILNMYQDTNPLHTLSPVCSMETFLQLQDQVKEIYVDDSLKNYILDITHATRSHCLITLGVSPRGSISLLKAAKAKAFIDNRNYILPDDIQALAVPILAHRIIISQEAKNQKLTPTKLIKMIVEQVPVR
ncbi:AAA family ATPase [Niameybacter massiliensis]|uniref:AAA family ATPase n=1 Tax=Niameybacter massiliensis TaxID=1658108 RepID=UPI0006B5E7C0|nr:MoxR family ATPase [Niameybacter massiliensis]